MRLPLPGQRDCPSHSLHSSQNQEECRQADCFADQRSLSIAFEKEAKAVAIEEALEAKLAANSKVTEVVAG
jgi:hypothetical protein